LLDGSALGVVLRLRTRLSEALDTRPAGLTCLACVVLSAGRRQTSMTFETAWATRC
jgi:hypothetical protein